MENWKWSDTAREGVRERDFLSIGIVQVKALNRKEINDLID